MMLEMTYQGSAGVGLLNRWDINAIPLNAAGTFRRSGPHPPRRADLQALSTLYLFTSLRDF